MEGHDCTPHCGEDGGRGGGESRVGDEPEGLESQGVSLRVARGRVVLEKAQLLSHGLAGAGSREGPTHRWFRSVSHQGGFRVGDGVLTGGSSKVFLSPPALLVAPLGFKAASGS